MVQYCLIRLVAVLPVVFFVMLFTFSLLYLAPGDPAAILAGDQATQDMVTAIRAELGLDRSFAAQFADWVTRVMRGDFGQSIFTREPVARMILDRAGPTLSLMVVTLVIALAVALPLGILAAQYVGRGLDRAVMALAVLGFSLPVFVLGYVLTWVFGLRLGWFPVQGYVALAAGPGAWLHSLFLPAAALSAPYIALIARITRASMIDVLHRDFIRTARAKGAGRSRVLAAHALRNALMPIVTVTGLGLTFLISGAVVTETVFALPGLGRLIVESILRRDYPVIQAVILIFSCVYLAINLLIDLSYTLIDPRISY